MTEKRIHLERTSHMSYTTVPGLRIACDSGGILCTPEQMRAKENLLRKTYTVWSRVLENPCDPLLFRPSRRHGAFRCLRHCSQHCGVCAKIKGAPNRPPASPPPPPPPPRHP